MCLPGMFFLILLACSHSVFIKNGALFPYLSQEILYPIFLCYFSTWSVNVRGTDVIHGISNVCYLLFVHKEVEVAM